MKQALIFLLFAIVAFGSCNNKATKSMTTKNDIDLVKTNNEDTLENSLPKDLDSVVMKLTNRIRKIKNSTEIRGNIKMYSYTISPSYFCCAAFIGDSLKSLTIYGPKNEERFTPDNPRGYTAIDIAEKNIGFGDFKGTANTANNLYYEAICKMLKSTENIK